MKEFLKAAIKKVAFYLERNGTDTLPLNFFLFDEPMLIGQSGQDSNRQSFFTYRIMQRC